MESIVFYLIEYGVYLLSFYVLYMLLFKGKSDHKFNRFYLISSNMICLVLPLVDNSIFLAQPELFSVVLSPIELVAEGTSAVITEVNQSVPAITIITVMYFIITAFFLARFIYGLLKINSYKVQSTISPYKDYVLIESDSVHTPFSFFNSIYLPKGSYKDDEKELILEHEINHIKFGHSIEKIFLLLNKVFFWWNPVSYKYFTELELVHEYQVDEKLCHSSSKKHYGQFLLSQLNTNSQFSFVNNISSHIKNRIIMISSKNKNTPSFIKWGAYLAMFVAIMFLHACNLENEEPLIEDNYKMQEIKKDEQFSILTRIDTVSIFDTETFEETVEITKTDIKVFKLPEVMPVFGDCSSISDVDAIYKCSNDNLLTFIYSNLKYPAEAREGGIEGMSVVQFVVDEQGAIGFLEIVKSLDPSTDKAVLDVLNKMMQGKAKWTAGRNGGENVATQFTLPVKFKLEG